MKKTILSLGIFLTTLLSANAQIDLLDKNGNVITDGQDFSFNTIDEHDAKLSFSIRNNTNQAIDVRGEVTAIQGSDGQLANFCIAECLPYVEVGFLVPEQGGLNIAANAISDDSSGGTYFLNMDNTSSYIKYTFKVYQIDALGLETGTPVHVNYIYDETLSTPEKLVNETTVYPTITRNNITVSVQEKVTASLYNIQGKLLTSYSLEQGENNIDISKQATGIYLLQLKNNDNAVITKKIVKQ
ncbi:MAG: T9SS type A sorting domain-containing protein [Mesonia hippocampi]|uniref:T9SS type A sorting domain-containing protein n=1 Tax=Mesonia hippocampi TaxID=1628250 RepID=UPI003F956763